MTNYKITVNGETYDVTVETVGAAAPAAASAPAAAPAPAPAAPQGSAGGTRVEAQVAGKIWKLAAQPGAQLSAGDSIVILESMKMEIPVVAPQAGTLASINVREGDSVEVGDLIATMN
jgi:biotin carboxyl carrier protein